MKLYVCWGTFGTPLHTHPCTAAHEALTAAGHEYEVVNTHSFGGIPGRLQTSGRKRVAEGTGKYWVPALELDDGTWISGSKEIAAWAQEHPAAAPSAP